jgi:vacuolar-type H+-ATPase subunit H
LTASATSDTLLESIRRKESEMKARVAAERAAAQAAVAEAERRRETLLAQADEEGRSAGEAERLALRQAVEAEVKQTVDEAEAAARALRTHGKAHVQEGVQHALAVVLGGQHGA